MTCHGHPCPTAACVTQINPLHAQTESFINFPATEPSVHVNTTPCVTTVWGSQCLLVILFQLLYRPSTFLILPRGGRLPSSRANSGAPLMSPQHKDFDAPWGCQMLGPEALVPMSLRGTLSPSLLVPLDFHPHFSRVIFLSVLGPRRYSAISLLLLLIFNLVFYWSIVDLQYCTSFRCTAQWFSFFAAHSLL